MTTDPSDRAGGRRRAPGPPASGPDPHRPTPGPATPPPAGLSLPLFRNRPETMALRGRGPPRWRATPAPAAVAVAATDTRPGQPPSEGELRSQACGSHR